MKSVTACKQTIYAFDRGTVLAGRRSWRGQAAAGAAAKGETDPVQPPPRAPAERSELPIEPKKQEPNSEDNLCV